MGRPSVGYYTKAGRRVYSVTEVLGKFKNPEPLIGWAFKKGFESGVASEKGLPAPRSAYAEKEQAAQAGSITHDMFECHILGTPYEYDGKKPPPGVMEKAVNGFGVAKRWLQGSAIKILSTEESLVSEEHGFGGTYDALGVDPGESHRLLDWKTSNHIYADYLVQVAAYAILLKECRGIDVRVYDILRFSKEHGDFEHKSFMDLEDGKAAFLAMLKALPHVDKLEARV